MEKTASIRRAAFRLTQRCSIQCRHCVYGGGPSRQQATDMAISALQGWMDQAAEAGIREFCFTGGEPFLVHAALRQATGKAVALGARAGVITNAFWAVNAPTARRTLEPLHGLHELAISADRFHQEHIPLERVRHAIVAARAVGIPPRVKITYTDSNEIQALQDALDNVLSPDEIDAEPVRRVGRMAESLIALPHIENLEGGCALTRAPTVETSGRVCGCCGPLLALNDHPLWLGDLREATLSQILSQAEFNVLYQFVRVCGPQALHRLIAPELDGAAFDESSSCSLCCGLFSDPRAACLLAARACELELFRRVAVERLLCFNEAVMLAHLPHASPAAGLPNGASSP